MLKNIFRKICILSLCVRVVLMPVSAYALSPFTAPEDVVETTRYVSRGNQVADMVSFLQSLVLVDKDGDRYPVLVEDGAVDTMPDPHGVMGDEEQPEIEVEKDFLYYLGSIQWKVIAVRLKDASGALTDAFINMRIHRYRSRLVHIPYIDMGSIKGRGLNRSFLIQLREQFPDVTIKYKPLNYDASMRLYESAGYDEHTVGLYGIPTGPIEFMGTNVAMVRSRQNRYIARRLHYREQLEEVIRYTADVDGPVDIEHITFNAREPYSEDDEIKEMIRVVARGNVVKLDFSAFMHENSKERMRILSDYINFLKEGVICRVLSNEFMFEGDSVGFNFGESWSIDPRTKFIVSELLKNAFVHGNHARIDAPIYLYMKLDENKKMQYIKVYDSGFVKKDADFKKRRIDARNAELWGKGDGLRFIKYHSRKTHSTEKDALMPKRHVYARQKIRSSHGNRMGQQTTVIISHVIRSEEFDEYKKKVCRTLLPEGVSAIQSA